MSQVLYELYLKDVIKLSRTLVIKSAISADTLNKRIEGIGRVVDYSDPTTWKYYLNLAGVYHQLDELMSVKSLDTLTEIDFTKENLLVHRATAKAYAYGTPYYRTLVDKFPKQEQLIRGILNPVDINKAIAADDHTILWYDKTLVEAPESNLLSEIQAAIYAWWRKNDSPSYNYTHDLYDSGLHAAFYSFLLGSILGIRLNNCHTSYAHSFHIWSYLAGKGRLDEFQDYLTTNQTLWLYRNIDYLTSVVGQEQTQEQLIEHLLTDRGFPIVKYDLQQNVSEMPESLTPYIECVQVPLNFTDKFPKERQTITVAELVEKEIGLARENPDYIAEEISEVNDAVTYSNITHYPTRVFESKVVDRSESKHVRLPDVLLNHWLYLSQIRRYNTVLTLTDPGTGDAFNLSAKDAFVLWLYLQNYAQGLTPLTIPDVMAKRVRKLNVPTLADLKALVNPVYVPEWLLRHFYTDQPAIGLVVSTEAFNALCHEIYNQDIYQYQLCTDQENLWSRVQAELVNLAFYQDINFQLAPEDTLYSTWFKERGLTVESLSIYDAQTLANEILDKATGTDLSKQYTLKDIHSAMLSLFKRLSSYTVQLIQSISSSPLIPIGHPVIRAGRDWTQERAHDEITINTTSVIKADGKDRERYSAFEFGLDFDLGVKARDREKVQIAVQQSITSVGPGRERQRVQLTQLRWSVVGE